MHRALRHPGAPLGLLARSRHIQIRGRFHISSVAPKATSKRRLHAAAYNNTAAPTAAPPEAVVAVSVAPTTVTLADGTTVTLVDPTPRQSLSHQQPSSGTVTWSGLLGALGLFAAAWVAAAATCFMLYVRPLLKAMSVTLAEMEQAAKDMQQAADHVEATSQLLQSQLPVTAAAVQGAADEVQELAGNINKAARLLTPSRLLKRTDSSSEEPSSSSGSSSQGEDSGGGPAAAEVTGSISGPGSLLNGIRELGSVLSSNSSSNNVTSVIPQITQIQNLAGSMPGSIADLWGSYEEDSSSGRAGSRSSSPAAGSSSSSAKTVWDALALTLSSAGASKRSLARLQADLKAAVNVISVLLAPAGGMLGSTAAAAATAAASSSKQEDQQQQAKTVRDAAVDQPAAAAAAVTDPALAAAQSPTAAASAASTTAADPAAAAAAAANSLAAAAVIDATESSLSSVEGTPLSSTDGRIMIAAGKRLAGSTAVLKSLSEEDIESVLAAAAAATVAGSSHDTDSSAVGADTGSSSSSSSAGGDIGGFEAAGLRLRSTVPPAGSSGNSSGSAVGTQLQTADAVAAAAAVVDPAAPTVDAVSPAALSQSPDAADASVLPAAAAAGSGSRSRSSSPSGRRRRKSKKLIEEDEWGVPTVLLMDSKGSSSGGSAGDIDQGAAETAAVDAAGVSSLAAADGGSSSSTSTAAARKVYPGAGKPAESKSSSSNGSSSNKSSSYMSAGGWVDSSYDSSDEEDYAGYKYNSYSDDQSNNVTATSRDRTTSGAIAGTAAVDGSSMMFAGYDSCQDVVLGDARPDDGITWSQLNQDRELMRRVFCDNQEEILQQGISISSGTRQQQRSPSPECGRQY